MDAIERLNSILAEDELSLVPVHDGLDFARPESERGKHIVAYDLYDNGANRGNVGRISLDYIFLLTRMHPRKVAASLCLGHPRPSYAKRRKAAR